MTLTIVQGMTQACGPVFTVPDAVVEGNELVELSLVSVTTIDSLRSVATLTIVDDGKQRRV